MENSGIISEIRHFATHDGPGIRTTVFLKGCPLSCIWCSNPETKQIKPELYFIQRRCKNYRSCITDCPEKAISNDIPVKLDRSKCNNCMRCVESCIYGAFQQVGKEYTVDEIFVEIEKDIPFYRERGGLTLSGGEPLFQPEFSIAVLKKCRKAGISTVMDTSGFAAIEVASEAAEYTDLALYDIKHMDAEKHLQATGKDNQLILENAIRFAAKTKIRISLPLIPGFNDDEKNLEETARFAENIKSEYIDVNPLHFFGKDKYQYLGLKDPYDHYKTMDRENIVRCRKIIESCGIKTTVGRMM
jgi:pyruvate formate lyase activating enzyme